MELKKAVAVCLISLFSAGLVVLIARALDLQAGARVEVQLRRIADELEAMRKGRSETGGGATEGQASATSDGLADGLTVYYFHGNQRCPTCRAIESQSREVVESDFDAALKDGRMVWRELNYEDSAVTRMAADFGVAKAEVVLVKRKGGEIQSWELLKRTWGLCGDQKAFADYVRGEIERMLAEEESSTDAPEAKAGDLPLPE